MSTSRLSIAKIASYRAQYRSIFSSSKECSSTTDHRDNGEAVLDHPRFANPPLSLLPLRMIIRSLCTSALSSSPLLQPSLRIMAVIAQSENRLLNPDRNPLLRWLLDKTMYAQFCAGSDETEVQETVARLKRIGFTGVVLCYAKEVPPHEQGQETQASADRQIDHWAKYTLETVRMTEPGDFVAVKFTGAGQLVRDLLAENHAPTLRLSQSIDNICQLAQQRGVRLLFDGEHDALQDGIDNWTLQYSQGYNTTPGRATIYGTYQAYKRAMPDKLSQHLIVARDEGFTLGVKLVRGAYMQSDPRELFFDTKDDTDMCYDSSAASVLSRRWNDTIRGDGVAEYPQVSLMLATHNATSVRRTYAIQNEGRAEAQISFAQLQGMADEISCELVQMNRAADNEMSGVDGGAYRHPSTVILPVYKYMAWGTTGECIKYLLRRVQENRDAVQRTREDRDAMWTELKRRMKLSVSGE